MRARFDVDVRYLAAYPGTYTADAHAIWYTDAGRQERQLGFTRVPVMQGTAALMLADALEALAADIRSRAATAAPPRP